MKIAVSLWKNKNDVHIWWENLEEYMLSIPKFWDIHGDINYENYVNETILKDIGILHYAGIHCFEEYIAFYSEEDYINFVLKWS